MDIWPPFPIKIFCYSELLDDEGQDNLIAALEHQDRVVEIDIGLLKRFAFETSPAVTQKPFPVLTFLKLSSIDGMVLPEEFLRGSAPHLRELHLQNIAYPAFPKLALSTTHLFRLSLYSIPITGYISPEAMATCLSTLPSLKYLIIEFQSPRSRPDRIGPPPPTHAALPALTFFMFRGVSEYLEDLVSRIDTPALTWFEMQLFMDLMFHIPQLHKFIARTKQIRRKDKATIVFYSFGAQMTLGDNEVHLMIKCKKPDWQASSMVQVCTQLSPLLSHVKLLRIREYRAAQVWKGNDIDTTLLFELFDHFPAAQELYISGELKPLIAQALQEPAGARAMEVLPALRNLFL